MKKPKEILFLRGWVIKPVENDELSFTCEPPKRSRHKIKTFKAETSSRRNKWVKALTNSAETRNVNV